MAEFETDVEVNLTGDLERKARSAETAIKRMTTRSARNLGKLKRASIGLSNGINRLGSKYSAILGAAGLGVAAKGVVNFNKKLKDIEVQAGLTTDQIANLKQSVLDVSQASDVRIAPENLLTGLDAVIEKTGDYKLASENIRNIGVAIRATGATGKDIGAVVAGLAKLDITAAQDVAEAMEILSEQGKEGAFTMANLAAEAGPLFASLAAMGQKGMGAVRTMGALAQTTQMATDNAAESSTAIQSLIKVIASKGTTLEGLGVTVFDQDALAEGRKEFLALDKIVKSIISASGGDIGYLFQTFGDEGTKALTTIAANFQKTGETISLDKFLGMTGNSGAMVKDAADKASTADAAITSLTTTFKRMAEENLSGPIQDLATAVNSIETEKLNEVFDVAGKAVAAAAGIWAVNKAVRGVAGGFRGISGGFRAMQALRGGTGSKVGNALNKATVQPVMVMNWPGNYGATQGGVYGKSQNKSMTNARGRIGAISKAGRILGRVGPLATGLSLLSFGSSAIDGDTRGMVSSGGMLAGGLAGAKAGALLGAPLGPLGAGVGSLVGAGLGAYAGDQGMASLYDYFNDGNANEITKPRYNFKGRGSRLGGNSENDLTIAIDNLARTVDQNNSTQSNLGRVVGENTEIQKTQRKGRGMVRGHSNMGGMSLVQP